MVVFFEFSSIIRCMRRVGAENLTPLDLEIQEMLRKIKRYKRTTTQIEQHMDNMDDLKEEEFGFRMGDGVTLDTA